MRALSITLLWLGLFCAAKSEEWDPYTGQPHVEFQFSKSTGKRLLVVGDSRISNNQRNAWKRAFGFKGWGQELVEDKTLSAYQVVNCGISGASIRSYINRGYWARVLQLIRPGDMVIIYFAGNDLRPIEDKERSLGELPGLGDRSVTVYNPHLKRDETVRTIGAYYNRIINDVKAAGGVPYVCTYFAGGIWRGGVHEIGMSRMFNAWLNLIAAQNEIKLIDLFTIMEDKLALLGEKKSQELFVDDHFHFTEKGASMVASMVAEVVIENHFILPAKTTPSTESSVSPQRETRPGLSKPID